MAGVAHASHEHAAGLALGIALWFAAPQLFSEGAANVALALFAFTPSLIAHFSVTTTDGIGALFVFLAAFQLVRWRRNPTRKQTVLMGLVLGGLLLAKLYTPPEMLLALILMLVLRRMTAGLSSLRSLNSAPPRANRHGSVPWKPMLAALGIALLILWAGYLFHVSHLKVGDGQVSRVVPQSPDENLGDEVQNAVQPAGTGWRIHRRIARGGAQQSSRTRRRGSWARFIPRAAQSYYPVAIALKWPTILLLLFFGSLMLGVRKTCQRARRSADHFAVWTVSSSPSPSIAIRHWRAAHPAAISVRVC